MTLDEVMRSLGVDYQIDASGPRPVVQVRGTAEQVRAVVVALRWARVRAVVERAG